MHDPLERPSWACLLHREPSEGRSWCKADDGFRTCAGCYDRFLERLKDVGRRYLLLNPAPGASGDNRGRGAPGFGSRSPASDHVIALRDPRSSRSAFTWRGADQRMHKESERPPLSVHGELNTIAWDIADTREVDGPDDRDDVHGLIRFISRHTDWLSRHDLIVDVDAVLRELVAQLRPVTGEPGGKRVGLCPNTIDEGDTSRTCKMPLFAPLKGDVIKCRGCERKWERSDWEKLGKLLQAETLQLAS